MPAWLLSFPKYGSNQVTIALYRKCFTSLWNLVSLQMKCLTGLFFQIRTKSPHRKCAIRYDKLYIDNVPYVYDESRGTVVRHYPQEPLRSGSRTNYSSLGNKLYNKFYWFNIKILASIYMVRIHKIYLYWQIMRIRFWPKVPVIKCLWKQIVLFNIFKLKILKLGVKLNMIIFDSHYNENFYYNKFIG